jgi:hypothetical protein
MAASQTLGIVANVPRHCRAARVEQRRPMPRHRAGNEDASAMKKFGAIFKRKLVRRLHISR